MNEFCYLYLFFFNQFCKCKSLLSYYIGGISGPAGSIKETDILSPEGTVMQPNTGGGLVTVLFHDFLLYDNLL